MHRRALMFALVFSLNPLFLSAEDSDAARIEALLVGLETKPGNQWALDQIAAAGAVAVAPVEKRLKSENVSTRARAIDLLARLYPHSKAAMPGVVAALRDPEFGVRARALEAIRIVPDVAVENLVALTNVLKDEKHNLLRRRVIDTLGSLQTRARPAVPALLEVHPLLTQELRQDVLMALYHIAPPPEQIMPLFFAALDEPEMVSAAARTLSLMGRTAAPAVPALEKALQQPGAPKLLLAEALVSAAGPRDDLIPIALEALRDSETRSLALRMLKPYGTRAAPIVSELGATLEAAQKQTDYWHRNSIVDLLAVNAKDAKPALPALMVELRRGEGTTLAILKLLKVLGPDARDAAPVVRELLTVEKESYKRNLIRETLHAIGFPQDADPVAQAQDLHALLVAAADADRTFAQRAEKSLLEKNGDAVLPVLRNGLKSNDATLRGAAARILVRTKDLSGDDFKLLIQVFQKDPDVEVRRAIARGFPRSYTSNVEELKESSRILALAGVNDADATVRNSCLLSLAGAPLEPAILVEIAMRGLNDTDAGVQRAAISLITRAKVIPVDPVLLDKVVSIAGDGKSAVNMSALGSLHRLGVPADRAVPLLRLAVQENDETLAVFRVESLAKYGREAQPALDVLLARLQTGSVELRIAIAQAILKIEGPIEPALRTLREIIRREPTQPPIHDSEFELALNALEQFEEKAQPALPELMAALAVAKEKDVNSILSVLWRVGVRNDDVTAVTKFSRSENKHTCFLAYEILSDMKPRPAVFFDLLKEKLEKVDAKDDRGGRLLEDPELAADPGIAICLSVLEHPNADMRATSVRKLDEFQPMSTATRERLMDRAEKDPIEKVRRAALRSACNRISWKKQKDEATKLIPILERIVKNDAEQSMRRLANSYLQDFKEEE